MRSVASRWPARNGRLAIGLTVLATAAALAAGPADAASAASPPGAASPAAGQPAVAGPALFLLNGDQVISSPAPDGRTASVVRLVPGAGAVITEGLGRRQYDIPAYALPFLDHGLNPSLFSLTALRKAESAGRLPVRLSYAGPRPALPGITITSTGAGTASGYLTAASARTFGAALARQFRADHARASYGRDGMFASGTTITVAGAGAWPARARPDFPMHTLTVGGTNVAGQPDTGDLAEVLNAANPNTFGDPIESLSAFYHGVAKFSVPAGPYWAIGYFGTGQAPRLVVQPQFTVSGQDTTVSLAASSAQQVTLSTPRPSVPSSTSVLVVRGGLHGTSAAVGVFSTSAWINPTKIKPTVGTLRSYTEAEQTSPAGARSPYAYLLAPASPPGVIPDQHWVITPASLATVTNRFYQARPSNGLFFGYGGSLAQWTSEVGGSLLPQAMPGTETQYVTASPSVIWGDQTFPQSKLAGDGSFGLLSPRPGSRLTENWNQYPLHPQPDAQVLTGAAARTVREKPSAYRIGNTLVLLSVPFSDNMPGHLGPEGSGPPGVTGRYAVYQNGAEIAHGNPFASPGPHSQGGPADGIGVPVRLTTRPSAIRLVLTATRKVTPPLSESTTTVWTWRSHRDPGARVPAGWFCQAKILGKLVRDCAVQPMLALDYHVRGMALDGSTAPGPQLIGLDVTHIQPAGQSRIASAAVQVSVNGGRTWRPARVRADGGGRFAVRFTPARGHDVTLRVSARDAAGSTVTETIRDAYRVRPQARTSTGDPAPRHACPTAQPGHASCYVIYQPRHLTPAAGHAGWAGPALTSNHPAGLGATQLEQAYHLPVSRQTHQTIAVSIAYNTPHLAQYLARYRAWYHLPACTTASGCLRIVNQHGQATPLPASSVKTGWDVEATLDVSMISAACPRCHIVVVEGNSNSFGDLAATENTAARLGAQVISNSYGARETGAAYAEARAYHHPGHTIVVATGDYGYTAAQLPAALATVTAVGGTELAQADNPRGWTERTWLSQIGASSSGCSAYVAKPAWQHDPHCDGRTVADVSAAASDISIYEPVYGGWLNVDGTSAAAPLVAGIYGLAGNAATIPLGYAYAHSHDLFDITKGTNSGFVPPRQACGDDYLCVAKPGYDGPTGLGTPNGTGAF